MESYKIDARMSTAPIIQGKHGKFRAYPDDLYLGQAICEYGSYGDEEAEFLLNLLEPGHTVVEVGANAGYLTIPLARKCKVIAVEPQLCAYELLCENIILNELNRDVLPVHAACGSEKGFIWMPDIGYEMAGNHGGLNASHKQFGRYQLKTPLITVDSLVQERIHLLKIDVEGMEKEVLQGSLETIALYKPLLYVENDRENKSEELIRFIWDLGYDCMWHTPYLFNPDNFFGKKENIWPDVCSFNMICAPKEHKRLASPITDPKARP